MWSDVHSVLTLHDTTLHCKPTLFYEKLVYIFHAVMQLFEALRYKPKDSGFDSRCVTGIFH